ncbi:hypothetical protein [Chelativorans sp. AA-79]|uniref:hypothetical protein n=1 Tax=Chelativorans sp. AA-79 TaxID=3028735 RepID=UPI0023F82563|nr:hypothetical protein [Chelativorans sp. AA-79]WEX10908.1 hypothetical protein PVE73_08240 [Chelativorans sp. AA-79]
MSRLVQLSFVLLFGLAGTSFAQPIYLGEQEFDTGNRDTMAAILERCAELAEDDFATVASSTPETTPSAVDRPEAAEAGDEPSAAREPPDARSESETVIDRDLLTIDIDGLASDGGEQEPAGEGADAGAPPGEDPGGETQPIRPASRCSSAGKRALFTDL